MALAARAPAQGESNTLRVAPPCDASARARLERRHVDLFRIQDGFRLVPQLRGQALDEQGRAVLGERVAGRRRRGADAPQGPEVVPPPPAYPAPNSAEAYALAAAKAAEESQAAIAAERKSQLVVLWGTFPPKSLLELG